MCLLTNQKKPFILKKDMKVYKLLTVLPTEAHPPYYCRYAYKYDKISYTRILKYPMDIPVFYSFEITQAFHSFSAIATAKKILREQDFHDSYKTYGKPVEIVECIIPKGSEIYRGAWGDDRDIKQVVSNQIIISKPKK